MIIVKVRDNSVSDICLSCDRHPISDSYVVWSLSRVLLLKSHGLYPSRLLSPWDFLGNITGVVCHFLLQVTVYNYQCIIQRKGNYLLNM